MEIKPINAIIYNQDKVEMKDVVAVQRSSPTMIASGW